MKILLLEWNSYGNLDIKTVLEEMGHQVVPCPFYGGIRTTQEEADQSVLMHLHREHYDFVFSFNYMPVVSVCCQKVQIPYVSWVYDSPYIHVYSYTVLNSCNYIFLFDYAVYEELITAGITTVYYLPLAVNEKRLEKVQRMPVDALKYKSDISFVGSLYDEEKHRMYDRTDKLSGYTKGYLDAIVQAQKQVYGYFFLEKLLTPKMLEEMHEIYPTDPNASTVMTPKAIYADYILARRVTALERNEVLTLLGERFAQQVKLYTNNTDTWICGVTNMGSVDYYEEMPYVFANSRINLNITLRSIKTGIPLRVFDILGAGGFLITNYQEELLEYFVPDEDLVIYYNNEDLLEKVAYYLEHEEERTRIAANGAKKVRESHTMKSRVEVMMDILIQNSKEVNIP